MLQLTSRGNYGILAVYYIAKYATDSYISIDEIVEHTQIPKPYLSKILQDLCRGGILLSRRGTGGGYTLAHPPDQLSLEHILEVIEGKLSLVSCLSSSNQCHLKTSCPISPLWGGIQNLISVLIHNITIADIINDGKRLKIIAQLETCRQHYNDTLKML